MSKFRVPRKTKKKLKKTMWLYPFDAKYNGYLMAHPHREQEDFDAWKHGKLIDTLHDIKTRSLDH